MLGWNWLSYLLLCGVWSKLLRNIGFLHRPVFTMYQLFFEKVPLVVVVRALFNIVLHFDQIPDVMWWHKPLQPLANHKVLTFLGKLTHISTKKKPSKQKYYFERHKPTSPWSLINTAHIENPRYRGSCSKIFWRLIHKSAPPLPISKLWPNFVRKSKWQKKNPKLFTELKNIKTGKKIWCRKIV